MGTTTRKQAPAAPQEQAAPLTLEDVRARHQDLDIWAGYTGTLLASPKNVVPWPLMAETPAGLDAAIRAVKDPVKDSQPAGPSEDGP